MKIYLKLNNLLGKTWFPRLPIVNYLLWPSYFSELLILSLIPLLLMPPHVDPPPSDSLLQLASMRTCSEPRTSLYRPWVQAQTLDCPSGSSNQQVPILQVQARIHYWPWVLRSSTVPRDAGPLPIPGSSLLPKVCTSSCHFFCTSSCHFFAPAAVIFFRSARASSSCTTSGGLVRPPALKKSGSFV